MGAHYAQVAQQLAPLLSYNENELALKLRPTVLRTNENGLFVTNQDVDLKRKLTFEQWQQVTQTMTGLNFGVDELRLTAREKNFYKALRQQAIFAVEDQQRVYPNKSLAAHVVGFAQDSETNFNVTLLSDLVGRDGSRHGLIHNCAVCAAGALPKRIAGGVN